MRGGGASERISLATPGFDSKSNINDSDSRCRGSSGSVWTATILVESVISFVVPPERPLNSWGVGQLGEPVPIVMNVLLHRYVQVESAGEKQRTDVC